MARNPVQDSEIDLGSAVTLLAMQAHYLVCVWTSWKAAFNHDDEVEKDRRFALMKAYLPAEHFFAVLEDALFRETAVSIAALVQTRKDALTLDTLNRLGGRLLSPAMVLQCARLLAQAKSASSTMNLVRNNAVAHVSLEYATARDSGHLRLSKVYFDTVDLAVSAIVEFVDIFYERLNGRKMGTFSIADDTMGALFVLLDEAKAFRALPFEIKYMGASET